MRIAVYTLTRDRLEYTQRSFESLKAHAGMPYSHFVVDQCSTDGTAEWLKDKYKPHWLKLLPENIGIAKGANMALDAIFKEGDWGLVIKMDNDCLVQSDKILNQIVYVFSQIKPLQCSFMLSPRVDGIINQPTRYRELHVGRRRIGLTGIIGGLFHCMPGEIYKAFRYNENTPRGAYNDPYICGWFRKMGGETGYIEGITVEHMDGTENQRIKHPEYHERKGAELEVDKKSGKGPQVP